MTRNTSFYYAFLVLPAAERRALTAVFDVCRAIDDSVDLETDPARAHRAVDRWREEIARVFQGDEGHTSEGRALQPFVTPFHLPRAQFDALIDGVAMDVTPGRFQTFADLEPYCHRVASSVGLICAEIFGYREPSVLGYARDLGVALQLTNILRDVGADYARGRLYVPIDALAKHGCTEADVRSAVAGGAGVPVAPALRGVLADHAVLAREFFARADAQLPTDHASRFLPAEIMRAIYADLLHRIESSGYQVFGPLIRVPRPAQATLAMTTWWRLRSRQRRS